LFSRFMSPQTAIRNKAYRDVLQARKQHIESLSKVLETSTDLSYEGSKHLAARLLGKIRASEAVYVLSKNLLFRHEPNLFSATPILSQGQYPCAVALVEIGYPSVEAMITKIEISSQRSSQYEKLDQEERELASWVLMQIMGRDTAVAKLETLAGERSGRDKERLDEAMTFIKAYKPIRVEPASAQDPALGR